MLRCLIAPIAALAFLLQIAPSASALSTELGDRCVGDDIASGTAIVLNNGPGADLPVSVPPEGSKVITHWRVQGEPGLKPIPQRLVAFEQVGEEDDREVGESALETVVGGANEFAARLPIPEYGHVGLRGPTGTLLCEASDHLAGIVEGPWGVGETRHFKIQFGGVPVTATVEPDHDGDGYGDLTQDRCPWDAAFESDCPTTLRLSRTPVRRRAILIEVTSSSAGSLEVFGQVRWRTAGRIQTAGLSSGGATTVSGGETVSFRLPLPRSVLRRLDRLPPGRSLPAKLTIRFTGGGGAVTKLTRTVALHGRKRLPRRR